MSRPAAILFDAGGTLVHMSPEQAGDIVEPLAGVRVPPDRMVAAHYVAMHALSARLDVAAAPHEEIWPFWVRTFLEAAGVPSGDEAVGALAAATGLWTRPIPGAAATMRSLRRDGYRVAVVSNADGTVRDGLDGAGFAGAYEFVLDSTEEGVSKPDPEFFHRALRRLGVAHAHAGYVGDSPFHDVGGAAAAGLAASVLVDPLGLAPDHQPRVGTVTELPDLLAGRG